MKTKFIFLIYFISLFPLAANSQNKLRAGEDRKDTLVTLMQNINNDKVLILFEDNDVIVKTSLSLFEDNMKQWLEDRSYLNDDKTLLDKIILASKDNDTINAEKIAEENKLKDRLQYRIADMLESGNCLIVDKKTTKPLTEIKVQTYSYFCGPLCGDGGRRFFVGNTMIFSVMDWIS